MEQSSIYRERKDNYYSNVCFDKAHELAEELLSMHNSTSTFLVPSEQEYLEQIIGKHNDGD